MSRKFASAGYRDPKRKPPRSPWVPVTDWYAEETRGCVKGKGTVVRPCLLCGGTSTHKVRRETSQGLSKPFHVCETCLPSPLPAGHKAQRTGG